MFKDELTMTELFRSHQRLPAYKKALIQGRIKVEYCKTRIFSVDKFSLKHCQRAFPTSIFRECVTCQNINKSNNIKMLLEMQLRHEHCQGTDSR